MKWENSSNFFCITIKAFLLNEDKGWTHDGYLAHPKVSFQLKAILSVFTPIGKWYNLIHTHTHRVVDTYMAIYYQSVYLYAGIRMFIILFLNIFCSFKNFQITEDKKLYWASL